jgi:hypothetical protein
VTLRLRPGASFSRVLVLASQGMALLLTACGALTAAPPPTPTAAPTVRAGANAAPERASAVATARAAIDERGAGAGQRRTRATEPAGTWWAGSPSATLIGSVDVVDGRTLTLATNTGRRTMHVPDSAAIVTDGTGSIADLEAGALVSVTGKPDGPAQTVRILPSGASPRIGRFPLNGAQTGNVMITGQIETFDGTTLALEFEGHKASIAVPPETQIVKPIPAALTDIATGTRVQAQGTVSGDTMTASTVTLLPAVGPITGRGSASAAPAP